MICPDARPGRVRCSRSTGADHVPIELACETRYFSLPPRVGAVASGTGGNILIGQSIREDLFPQSGVASRARRQPAEDSRRSCARPKRGSYRALCRGPHWPSRDSAAAAQGRRATDFRYIAAAARRGAAWRKTRENPVRTDHDRSCNIRISLQYPRPSRNTWALIPAVAAKKKPGPLSAPHANEQLSSSSPPAASFFRRPESARQLRTFPPIL